MNTELMSCNQKDCPNPPVYRFTWPGKPEQCICAEHAPKLRGLANAIGLPLQMIPL